MRYLVQHMKGGRWEDAYETPIDSEGDRWTKAFDIYRALVSDRTARIMQVHPWRLMLCGAPSGGTVKPDEISGLEAQWAMPAVPEGGGA